MDRGKPSVSGVSESGPAQAVDSLTVSDTNIASETLESYLGRLLKSEDDEMSVGHRAMSDLGGIVGLKNSTIRDSPFLFGSIIQFRSGPWVAETRECMVNLTGGPVVAAILVVCSCFRSFSGYSSSRWSIRDDNSWLSLG